MSKIVPMDLIKSIRGKICGHSDIYFQMRGQRICTGKICQPRDITVKPYSAEELERHNKFRSVITAIKLLTAEQKAAYLTDFQKQSKYKTLRGYIFAKEYAKL